MKDRRIVVLVLPFLGVGSGVAARGRQKSQLRTPPAKPQQPRPTAECAPTTHGADLDFGSVRQSAASQYGIGSNPKGSLSARLELDMTWLARRRSLSRPCVQSAWTMHSHVGGDVLPAPDMSHVLLVLPVLTAIGSCGTSCLRTGYELGQLTSP